MLTPRSLSPNSILATLRRINSNTHKLEQLEEVAAAEQQQHCTDKHHCRMHPASSKQQPDESERKDTPSQVPVAVAITEVNGSERKMERSSSISARPALSLPTPTPRGGALAVPDTTKLSWPLVPSPGSSGSSVGGGQQSSNGSSIIEQVPPESFVDCVEKFLLCEHKNSLNILLYGSTLALFLSSSLRRYIPIVPATTSSNVAYKTLVSLGLACQLFFELKNVERSEWKRIGVRPGEQQRKMQHANSGTSLYRLPSSSSLSPQPISTPSNAQSTGAADAIGAISGPLPTAVIPVPLSNLTAVDRQLESVGMSLLMCAFNIQLLKAFLLKGRGADQGGSSAGTTLIGQLLFPPMSVIRKVYLMCNALGVMAALKQLTVAICSNQMQAMKAAAAASRAREEGGTVGSGRNCSSSGGAAPPAGGAASAAAAAAADPHRSLPLILPSFSFIELIHALFLCPQQGSSAIEMLGQSVIQESSDGMGARASATLATPLSATVSVLRIMAILSAFYWSAHYKYTEGNGVGGPAAAGVAGAESDGSPQPLHMPVASAASAAFQSFWRGTGQLASNIKIVACLLVFTKLMA